MSIRKIYGAITDPGTHGILAILLALSSALFALSVFTGKVFWALPGALFAGLFVYALRVVMKGREGMSKQQLEMAAARWARAGANDDEVRERWAAIQSMGPAAAIAAAGVAMPAYNIDGTPMVGTSGVDIYGRPMGVLDDTLTNFEAPAFDVATGMPVDPMDAYTPPVGMDPHSPNNSF